MTANLIDLRQPEKTSTDDLLGLHAYLTQLIGEQFRFARVSYGNELTLHFGDLRPARSPKLKKKPYGAYILGFRGSPWVIKAGAEPLVLVSGISLEDLTSGFGKLVRNEELEANPLVRPDSHVLSATPFVVKPVDGFGLQLRTSDGSTVLILPAVPEAEPEEEEIVIADWELSSPGGLLGVGPGPKWSFNPSKPK